MVLSSLSLDNEGDRNSPQPLLRAGKPGGAPSNFSPSAAISGAGGPPLKAHRAGPTTEVDGESLAERTPSAIPWSGAGLTGLGGVTLVASVFESHAESEVSEAGGVFRPVSVAGLIRSPVVQSFLQKAVGTGSVSPQELRRSVLVQLAERQGFPQQWKPDATCPVQLFEGAPSLFAAGASPVTDSGLSSEAFDALHKAWCPRCAVAALGAPQGPACPSLVLLECLRRGWRPPIPPLGPGETPRAKANHPSTKAYHLQVGAGVQSWLDQGIVQAVHPLEASFTHPLGAVVKKSELAVLQVITGVAVSDGVSLAAANSAWRLADPDNCKTVKVRTITDCKSSGLNERAGPAPFFRSSKIGHLLQHVVRDGWIAVTDASQYFLMFPLAEESRDFFRLFWDGKTLRSARACFGFNRCPYFTLTFTAVFREFIEEQIKKALPRSTVGVAAMTDDFGITSARESDVRMALAITESTLHSVGFATAKTRVDQRVQYLGVIIDTQTMSMSFDAGQAEATSRRLEAVLALVKNRRAVPESELASLLGKLGWWCEVMQAGRAHTRSLFLLQVHGSALFEAQFSRVESDLVWWLTRVDPWRRDQLSGREYPILSCDALRSDPEACYVIQSDASGTDGAGFFHGALSEANPAFSSWVWTEELSFITSHHGELAALLVFARETEIENCLLLWVSDSSAAVWSVNKGRCREEEGLAALLEIFDRLDDRRISVIALWVPREQNQVADHLSHLAHLIHRTHTSGRLSGLSLESFM